MDLLSTIHKSGSRGGRDSFKWSDVASSNHRENYLGHSLMAPVGRWQKGRDLNWYAKAEDNNGEDEHTKKRKEEIKKIKEKEQDAMAIALGFAPPVDPVEGSRERANEKEVQRAIKDVTDTAPEPEGVDVMVEGEGVRGVGYDRYGGKAGFVDNEERLAGYSREQGGLNQRDKPHRRDKERKRSGSRNHDKEQDRRRRYRSRSIDHSRMKNRERERRHRRDDEKRRRSRSPDRDRRRGRRNPSAERYERPRRDSPDYKSYNRRR
ncbi:MAG: hypothetical protein M1834_000434 [Cirrosporium novae-zelandiae]|nr:MAG: hypothetical protein M1834_000434 [Cirrosporium novae-zelandiae]